MPALSSRSFSSRSALDFYRKLESVTPFEIKAVKTDNGTEFLGGFEQSLQKRGVTHCLSHPRTPKSHPHIERFNRTLREEFVDDHLEEIDKIKELNEKLIDYPLFFNAVRPRLTRSDRTSLKPAHPAGILG